MAANSVTLRLGVEGNQQVEAAIKKIGDTTKQQFEAATKSVGLARHEVVNLTRQLNDVGVSLLSGQSPFMVLIQQGGQVADVFGSRKGGMREGVKALGESLSSLATKIGPIGAVGGAVAAASAVAVAALLRWQSAQDALTVSLNALGRASGLTLAQVNAVAGGAAARAGLSTNTAQALAAQFLGAGVSGGSLGGAIGVTRDLGRKLGLKEDEAASTLAQALADPARGAAQLADKFGLLTRAQVREIETLDGLGDKSGATAKLVEGLAKALDKMPDPTSRLTDAFERGAAKLSDAFSKIGKKVAEIPGSPFAPIGGGTQNDQAAAEAEAISRGTDAAKKFMQPFLKTIEDADLAAKAITATTYAQREAVLMEKARVEALRDSANALKINTQAEAERTRMLAEATAKVDDYARSTQRSIESLGKTSFERARQQVRQERDDLLRQVPGDEPPRAAILRADAARRAPRGRSAVGRSVDALVAEAARRGLEPTEENFAKLEAEGFGAEPSAPRIVPADAGSAPVSTPRGDGGLSRRVRSSAADADAAIVREAQAAPLRQARDDLAAYNRLLDAQADAFGKSAGEAARLQKEQELLNQYTREHIPITAEMRAQIGQTAEEWGRYVERLQQVQDKNAELVQSLDQVRGVASGALSSFVGDLVRGESAGAALNRVLDQILQTAINIAAQKLTEGLFGKGGTNGADSLGGGFLGSLFSSAKSFFGFADGGVMTSSGPLPLRRYAWGGVASSPQFAMFGEGSRPEAYVPLPDGRSIPAVVDLKNSGGGGDGGGPRISIQNYAAGVAVEPRVTRREIRLMIREEHAQIPGVLAAYERAQP
jgi:hypothetical protein